MFVAKKVVLILMIPMTPASYVWGAHERGPRNTEAAFHYTWAGAPIAAQAFVWLSGCSFRLFLYS